MASTDLDIQRLLRETPLTRAEHQAPILPGAWFKVVEQHEVADAPAEGPEDFTDAALARLCQTLRGAPEATLHVLHRGGGGTERHIAELAARRGRERHVVLFTH